MAVLASVDVTSRPSCGADKPLLTVTIATVAGSRVYTDDFYACQSNGTYVSGIDALFTELEARTK